MDLAKHTTTQGGFNEQNRRVQTLLAEHRITSWDTNIAGPVCMEARQVLRSEKRSSDLLHGQQGLLYTASDKAETFAVIMEDRFQPNYEIYNEDHIDHIGALLSPNNMHTGKCLPPTLLFERSNPVII